jgi:hypothetical protein
MRTIYLQLFLAGFIAFMIAACTGSSVVTHSEDGDGADLPVYDGDLSDGDADPPENDHDSDPKPDGDLDLETESDTAEEETPSGDGDSPEIEDDPLALYGVLAEATSARNVRLRWVTPIQSPCTVHIERSLTGDYAPWRDVDCSREKLLDVALTPESRVQYRLSACVRERCGDSVYTVPVNLPPTQLNPVTITRHEPETPDILVLCGQLDGSQDYTGTGRIMALAPDGTIWWEFATEEFGAVTEVQPLPDHTLAVGAYTYYTRLDLDGSLIAHPTHFKAHHDIDQLPDGRLAFLLFDQFESPPGRPVLGDGIGILNEDGQTLDWQWWGRDHIDMSDYNFLDIQANLFNLGYDWTHANSLTADLDNGVIYMNVRNLDRIYAIDYPSGDVRWIMGDGGNFGADIWAHSHNPIFYEPGRMLIFDNGFQRGGLSMYSRVIDVAFDPEAQTAEVVWEYREDPDFYSLALGAVELLADGSMLVTDGMNGRVFIITRDKRKLWEMRIPTGMYIYKAVPITTDYFLDW